MQRIYFIVIIVFISCCTISKKKTTGQQINSIHKNQVIQTASDSIIFKGIITQFAACKQPIGELIIAIGKTFEGSPYVASTLENNQTEKLVVNLREFDCTTFVETILALTLTIKSEKTDYQNFLQNLKKIRYRNGNQKLYPSRLHYFSDWLYNNKQKHVVSLPKLNCCITCPKQVNFMSTHADKYPILQDHPSFIESIKKIEEHISKRNYYYIPKEQLKNCENELKNGDIAGITTNIAGLDIVHTALITIKEGRAYILHASSTAKKIVISNEPLADYLKKHKIQTGIMLGRPLPPAKD